MTVVRSLSSIERYPSAVEVIGAPFAPRLELVATSQTENTIDLGEQTFVVHEPTFVVTPGMRIRATAVGGTSHWMEGPVVSYDGQTLVMRVDLFPIDILYGPAFLRTFSAWDIGVVGMRGMTGATGDIGPMGLPGPNLLEPGPQGEEGIQGLPGRTGTTIKGSYASLTELKFYHPVGFTGDGYIVGEQRDLYVWDEENENWLWRHVGNVAGSEGPTGPLGPIGPRGHGLRVHGIADEEALLPATDLEEGEFWITKDDQRGWFWDGTDWIDAGQRPLGPTGPQGEIGPRGFPGPMGNQGPPGLDGIITTSIQAPLNVTAGGQLRLATRGPLAVISGRLGLNVLEPLTIENNVIELPVPTDASYGFKGTVIEEIWTTGDVKITYNRVADPGWLLMDDGTIGDASSGANHQHADYEALFELFFNDMSDANVPLYTSSGASRTRSQYANAEEAWEGHCRIALPRMCGRALAVAGAGAGLTTRALVQNLGAQTHTQTVAQMADHAHGAPGGATLQFMLTIAGWTLVDHGATQFAPYTIPDNTGTNGSGNAMNIVQPTSHINVFVHL